MKLASSYVRSVLTTTFTLVMLLLAFPSPATAAVFSGAEPVARQQLDHIRGGFALQYDMGDLALALDLTQTTMIRDDALRQIQGLSMNSSAINGLESAALTTVVQNSLDNQVINTVSVMNITLTSHALAQAAAMRGITQNMFMQFMR